MSTFRLQFAPPTPDLLEHIIINMREDDIKEIRASHGYTPRQSINEGVKASRLIAVAIYDGTPVAVFGCTGGDLISGCGSPWLLGTDGLFTMGKELIKFGRAGVDQMMRQYNYLENYVHVDNVKSINWLKRLGFSFDEPKPYGVNDELFMRFHMRKEHV